MFLSGRVAYAHVFTHGRPWLIVFAPVAGLRPAGDPGVDIGRTPTHGAGTELHGGREVAGCISRYKLLLLNPVRR